jgi:hypothetical protein
MDKKDGGTPHVGSYFMPLTMQYYYRNKAIKEYYHTIKDLFKFMQVNPYLNYRYLFIPQEQLMPNYDILEFGLEYTSNAIEWGKVEAKAVIALGEGVAFT